MTTRRKLSQQLFSGELQTCPACSEVSEDLNANAVISPWVLELAEIKAPKLTQYKICRSCGSGWFKNRYSDNVLNSLYRAYRGDHYFEVRNRWEPTYSRALNGELNHGEIWMKGRQRQILNSLDKAGIKVESLKSVLDFGGGHGGVMPPFEKRYLLEANENTEAPSDIVLIRSIEEAKELKLDLVMCCGVLEHMNNPGQLIQEILEIKAKYYLFEVPTGTPLIRQGIGNNRQFMSLVSCSKILWSTLQKIERRVPRKFRNLFPLRCSEHLQFFSFIGLRTLLENQNLKILEISETAPNSNLADSKALGFEIGLIAVTQESGMSL